MAWLIDRVHVVAVRMPPRYDIHCESAMKLMPTGPFNSAVCAACGGSRLVGRVVQFLVGRGWALGVRVVEQRAA
eukprot:361777-Chlamydomonas_euryale.AAC.1